MHKSLQAVNAAARVRKTRSSAAPAYAQLRHMSSAFHPSVLLRVWFCGPPQTTRGLRHGGKHRALPGRAEPWWMNCHRTSAAALLALRAATGCMRSAARRASATSCRTSMRLSRRLVSACANTAGPVGSVAVLGHCHAARKRACPHQSRSRHLSNPQPLATRAFLHLVCGRSAMEMCRPQGLVQQPCGLRTKR